MYLLASMGYHLWVRFWPTRVLNIFLAFTIFIDVFWVSSRVEGVFGVGGVRREGKGRGGGGKQLTFSGTMQGWKAYYFLVKPHTPDPSKVIHTIEY